MCPPDWKAFNESFELVFEGIDTYSTVILNGDTLGTTDNAHRAYRFSVSRLNKGLNTLVVSLHAAVDKGQTKLDASPWPVPVSNEARPQGRQTSSVSRKALYHYGWDWGASIGFRRNMEKRHPRTRPFSLPIKHAHGPDQPTR